MRDTVARRAASLAGASYNAYAMNLLRPLEGQYVPWTASAMRPAAIASVINDMILNKRKLVVELGSGVSTIYLARAIEKLATESFVLSFEHDAAWASAMQARLQGENLQTYAKVLHAPLQTCPGYQTQWYDVGVVRSALRGRRVDAVVCDGPPAFERGMGMARLPAIPVLSAYLADKYAIFLDDAYRVGERRIMKEWSTMLKIVLHTHLIKGSFAFGHKGAAMHPIV